MANSPAARETVALEEYEAGNSSYFGDKADDHRGGWS
jgi:hypothetical protein